MIENAESRKEYRPENYVRMFAGKSFVYILTDLFLRYYNSLDVLSVQDTQSWMSFLPKVVQKETETKGLKLYTSSTAYQNYRQEFDEYIQSSTAYFESTLTKDVLNESDVQTFFDTASKHFLFYSKTEFFYTNLLDTQHMVLSVQEFDDLKINGRKYLNKIIFEEKGYARTFLKRLAAQTDAPHRACFITASKN